MISILIITKETNSVNIAHRVIAFVPCTSSDHGLYLYQVSCNILNGFRAMERTRFQY